MKPGPEQSPEQTPQQIASALEEFLAEHPQAVLLEDGKALFDMRFAKYTLDSDHGRCSCICGARSATSSAGWPRPRCARAFCG
jgi:hypothetical protein